MSWDNEMAGQSRAQVEIKTLVVILLCIILGLAFLFYLYKLNVPKISVIKKAGPFSFLRNTTGTFVANGVSGKEFRIPYNDLNFEVFIPFRIRPEWVESVTSYDDMPWSKVFHD